MKKIIRITPDVWGSADMKVELTTTAEYRLRLRLFGGLIWLACWLASKALGCRFEYSTKIMED